MLELIDLSWRSNGSGWTNATSLGSVGQGPCFRRSNSFQSPKQKQTDKQKQKMKLKQGCVQLLVQSSERQITGNKNNAWPHSVTKPTNDFVARGGQTDCWFGYIFCIHHIKEGMQWKTNLSLKLGDIPRAKKPKTKSSSENLLCPVLCAF